MDRSSAYWPARVMLAVGIVATALVFAVGLLMVWNQPMFDTREELFGLPQSVVVLIVAGGFALFGLGWLIRIIRGLDEGDPPPWRYRNRR